MTAIDMRCEIPRGSEPVSVIGEYKGGDFLGCVASFADALEDGDLALRRDRIDPVGDHVTCWPCATWVPSVREVQAVEALADVPAQWVGMVRCVPELCGGPALLSPWLIGDLAATLADVRRPLLVDLRGTDPPFDSLFHLAASNPMLPVLIGLAGSEDYRIVRALVLSAPNILLESSGLATETLVSFVQELGPHRLVFGSTYPATRPTQALRSIEALHLPEIDLRQVLELNALSLLNGHWRPNR